MKFTSKQLSEALAFYRREGFVVIENIFPRQQLQHVLTDTLDIVLASLRQSRASVAVSPDHIETLHDRMHELLKQDVDLYLRAVRLCAKTASLQYLFLQPAMQELARGFGLSCPVLQSDSVLHIMSERLRIPGGYDGLKPHQDWTALQSSLDLIVCWVPLVDIDENRFPLELVPGSHHQGLIPGQESRNCYELDLKRFPTNAFIPLSVAAGDLALMSGFMVHRSGLQGDQRLRLSASHRVENALEPSYVDRRYPFCQRKTIDRTLIEPGFPSEQEIRQTYGFEYAGN